MVWIAPGLAFIAVEAVESMARPRGRFGRTLRSLHFRIFIWLLLFGFFLALFGNVWMSSGLDVLAVAAVTTGSNLKYRVLDEPLVFSDLAIVAAAFRFPRLYLFAIPNAIRCAILLGIAGSVFCIARGFVMNWQMHALGLVLTAAGAAALQASIRAPLMRTPDLLHDVRRHGVLVTLFFYWQRWLASRLNPIEPPADKIFASTELIIVVQNESFCDPRDLAAENEALRGLNAARQLAWAWGNLEVSSFGAYTMRTEFGVLCGVDESTLGFRRYDPFPTASGQAGFSLPARLPDHRSIFLHPYDLRFFRRNDVMQSLGFDEILGAAAMPTPEAESGPYVSDLVLAEKLADYIENAAPSLIYTVTMENHGPWTKGRVAGQPGGWPGYLHHLRNGDAMLEMLVSALRKSKRDAVLAFFGDHRPSIPGVVENGTEQHTPYVLLRFNNGECHSGPGRIDLTPAGLHHAILAAASVALRTPAERRNAQGFDRSVAHN